MGTTKGNKRIDTVDVLRAVGILIMVMGHVGFGGKFDRYIHSFHMPLFFLISGYLYAPKREMGIKEIVLKRAHRLLLPYLIYATINYFFWLVLKHDDLWYVPIVNLVTYNTKELPIAGALWFLTALFFAEVYYLLFERILKNDTVRATIVVTVAFVASYVQNSTGYRMPLTMDIALVCMGFLEVGRILKNVDKSALMIWVTSKKSRLLLMAFTLFLVNAAFSFVNEYVNIRGGLYGFVPLFWINAVIGSAAYLAGVIWFKEITRDNNVIRIILKNIGQKSMIFVCLNQLVILLVSIVFEASNLTLNIYVRGVIVFIISVIVLYLLSIVIGRIESKSIKRLFGI